jgi:hypothetical protein
MLAGVQATNEHDWKMRLLQRLIRPGLEIHDIWLFSAA